MPHAFLLLYCLSWCHLLPATSRWLCPNLGIHTQRVCLHPYFLDSTSPQILYGLCMPDSNQPTLSTNSLSPSWQLAIHISGTLAEQGVAAITLTITRDELDLLQSTVGVRTNPATSTHHTARTTNLPHELVAHMDSPHTRAITIHRDDERIYRDSPANLPDASVPLASLTRVDNLWQINWS